MDRRELMAALAPAAGEEAGIEARFLLDASRDEAWLRQAIKRLALRGTRRRDAVFGKDGGKPLFKRGAVYIRHTVSPFKILFSL